MKPETAIIRERKRGDFTILTIDTEKAKYQSHYWRAMGDYGKRKFENWLVMTRSKERLLFYYV